MKQALLLVFMITLTGATWSQVPQTIPPSMMVNPLIIKVTPDDAYADSNIFVVVDQDPEFPGGMDSLYHFLAANIKYPCSECDVIGKVYVTFVIEKDGSITNPKVLRDIGPEYGFGDEALRVVKLMPKWKPGRQRGKPVRFQFNLPINFTRH